MTPFKAIDILKSCCRIRKGAKQDLPDKKVVLEAMETLPDRFEKLYALCCQVRNTQKSYYAVKKKDPVEANRLLGKSKGLEKKLDKFLQELKLPEQGQLF